VCGIAGIVYEDGSQIHAVSGVRKMIALQRHRGPDGEGYYDHKGVSLGHCRLSIIDISNAGHQPMSDPSGRFWITFNGEIYNYLELAKELRTLGYIFQGRSDTEVLLAAYCQWQEACLDRLRGMFAFAIWDADTRSLFAARDRFGIKPFHYWTNGQGILAFASEIKALLQFVPDRKVNIRLAREFLAWNLLDHMPSETMLADIKRLPPAHYLKYRQTGITISRYWSLGDANEELVVSPEKRARLNTEFRDRLEESVSLHLRSDVPVGTSLSGGLDSSAIACLVSSQLKKRGMEHDGWQHAFSACFNEPELDERPYIKAVAAASRCQTHFVFPTGDGLRDELDNWLWHQDEPVSGSNMYAHFCVARLARQSGIKVLLDGQGADEQLAGYRKFILVYLRQLFRKQMYGRAAKEALLFLSSPAILRTSRFAEGRRYIFHSTDEVKHLWPGSDAPQRPASLGLTMSLAERLQADLMFYSLPVLLRYEDRNTMAFGVESRVPFVDHVFVEWLSSLPGEMFLSGGWTKRVLREGLADVLPNLIRVRKTKLGFLTPESKWLSGSLAGWLTDTLRMSTHLRDVVEPRNVWSLLLQRNTGNPSLPVEKILFRLAIYESWARMFLRPHAPRYDAGVEDSYFKEYTQ
jgi:asparagine synthase (glutamine-hydrolysing)